jgi:hypothetical protein
VVAFVVDVEDAGNKNVAEKACAQSRGVDGGWLEEENTAAVESWGEVGEAIASGVHENRGRLSDIDILPWGQMLVEADAADEASQAAGTVSMARPKKTTTAAVVVVVDSFVENAVQQWKAEVLGRMEYTAESCFLLLAFRMVPSTTTAVERPPETTATDTRRTEEPLPLVFVSKGCLLLVEMALYPPQKFENLKKMRVHTQWSF